LPDDRAREVKAVILGDLPATNELIGGRTTLDDLFRRAAQRRPDAIALCDPPNRARFTDGAPRRLSYCDADRIVSAIAARLCRLGLKTDAIIAVQLPNTVEAVLTILGVLRAGMIAAPLPLLWRKADMIAALGRIGPKAIITTAQVGGFNHCELAMQVAAEMFPVRYVCGFGETPGDGAVAFDDLLLPKAQEPLPQVQRDNSPAGHVAVATFEVTSRGHIAIGRNHMELIGGGLAALLEGRLKQDSVLLGCTAIGSFAGLALTVVPWLLTGGTLSLHHSFDALAFSVQSHFERCDTIVLPGPLAQRFVQAGLLSHPQLQNVLAVWRMPERLATSPQWQHPYARLIDVAVFGETGLICARRGDDGGALRVPLGAVFAPRGAPAAVEVAQIARTEAGHLAMRGPMVPRHPFPPGIPNGTPRFEVDGGGFVDTGYPCRLDRDAGALELTGPPPGVVNVGGYRFLLSELQSLTHEADTTLAALPDALTGSRLSGNAADPGAIQAALFALGVNPLVSCAFGTRRTADPAGGHTERRGLRTG
jgi:non-ribosomal peptide synthetase component E (peptide arylation enzyme)